MFSAVSIGGLEVCMQQSCQSQSWSELNRGDQSVNLSFQRDECRTEYVFALENEWYRFGLN